MDSNLNELTLTTRETTQQMDHNSSTIQQEVSEIRNSMEEVRRSVDESRREIQQTRYMEQQYYQHALDSGFEYQPPPYGLFDTSFYEEIQRPPPPPPPQDWGAVSCIFSRSFYFTIPFNFISRALGTMLNFIRGVEKVNWPCIFKNFHNLNS